MPPFLLELLSNGPIAFRSRRALSRVGHYRHSLYWNQSITSRPNLRRQTTSLFLPLSPRESPSYPDPREGARAHPRAPAGLIVSERYAIEKSPGSCGLITMFRNNVLCHAVDCKLFGYKKGVHLRSPPGVMVRSARAYGSKKRFANTLPRSAESDRSNTMIPPMIFMPISVKT